MDPLEYPDFEDPEDPLVNLVRMDETERTEKLAKMDQSENLEHPENLELMELMVSRDEMATLDYQEQEVRRETRDHPEKLEPRVQRVLLDQ